MDGHRDSRDEHRPGLRARTVRDVARDLLLARDPKPKPVTDADGDTPIPSPDIWQVRGQRGRAIFLVGAGVSASAGIPLAAEVAKECVKILAHRYLSSKDNVIIHLTPEAALDKLIEASRIPEHYKSSSLGPNWVGLYTYIFAEHLKSPNHQREVIASIIGEREFSLNWAHSCLGHLVKERYIHTVLTTNFDQLVLQGIIRTGIMPVVADGLESLTRISP